MEHPMEDIGSRVSLISAPDDSEGLGSRQPQIAVFVYFNVLPQDAVRVAV